MILPDANLLLYAYDSSSPHHGKAAAWLTDCFSGTEPIGFCSVVLFAFLRIGTNRKAFVNPMTVDEAIGRISQWLRQPIAQFVDLQFADVNDAFALLKVAGVGGNLSSDAQIAALGKRFNAIVHTADADFARFPGVRWFNPILGIRSPK